MKKPELLAPAGSMESLKAAIEAGCDAVYLGGYMFGARTYAHNFSLEELKEAIIYSHLYGIKVYVTVNTLVYEEEVETFMEYIDTLYRMNVDAIIIQDLGMLDLVRQTYPLLEVHASTQMHIHNLEGVQFMEKLGLKRVVLARECEIDLIKEIKNKTNIELEIFVHGALCISYSGQCLMSSLIGGRSGNRGSCAGSCRQKYDLIANSKKRNQEEYLLSTKDLNTLENIGQLIDSGVDSFKIEGRMKRPEYVYLVVKLYRKAIDQYFLKKQVTITEKEILELKKIFHRGFTKGFLFSSDDIVNSKRPNHMGIPIGKVIGYRKGKAKISLTASLQNGDGIRIIGKKDSGTIVTKIIKNGKQEKMVQGGIVEIPYSEMIQVGDMVLKTTDKKQLDQIHEILLKPKRKVPITLSAILKIDSSPVLTLSDSTNTVSVTGHYKIEKASNSGTSSKRIQEQLLKFGDSIYEVSSYHFEIEESLFIPIKELNQLRREAILKLNEARCYTYPYQKGHYERTVPSFPVEKNRTILITNELQYKIVEKENFKYIYVEKEELYQKLKKDSRVILKTPRVFHRIQKKHDVTLVGELGTFFSYPQVFTDFSFNVTNSYAVAFLFAHHAAQVTLSLELDKKQIQVLIENYKKRYHAHPNLELIIYGKEEVMISKYHLLKQYTLQNGYLKDRFSNLYKIEEQPNFMKIYNFKPRLLTEEFYDSLMVNSVRYQLLDETEKQIQALIKKDQT